MDWDFDGDGHPGAFGGLGRAIMAIASLFGGFILLLGAIVVAVLLVRFLLVATKAGQLYIDRHTPDDQRHTPASGSTPPIDTTPSGTAPSASRSTPAQDTTPPDIRAGERPPSAGVVTDVPVSEVQRTPDASVAEPTTATPTAAYPTTPLPDTAEAQPKAGRAPRSRTTKKPPTATS